MSATFEGLSRALSRHYRIERELGRGGMSLVLLAEDLARHRLVAIKVINPDVATEVGAARFLREIEIVGRLSHPHILPLHDAGEANGYVFYAMPYVDGESLRQRLNRDKQLPVDHAIRIAQQVASALGYAHSCGVVHRDVKPENILLSSDVAVLTDFGIARAIARSVSGPTTQSGVAVGTPAYMSPEQAGADDHLDGRSDIYSLGCVLYEMLAGEAPFTGATPQAIMARKLSQDVPSLRLVRETVPAPIEDAIRRALAITPADRFPTALHFADSLTRHADVSLTRPPISSRTVRLITYSLVAALLLGGAAVWRYRLTPDRTPRVATRFVIIPPSGVRLEPEKGTPTIVVSPEGSRVVYLGWDSVVSRLYVRDIDRLEPRAIPGTAGAIMPFFSPDGKWIGFVSDRKLKRVALSGGPPITIAEVSQPRGASWASDEQIILTPSNRSGLMRVPAAGGTPVALTHPRQDRGELNHRWGQILPGNAAALFTIWFRDPDEAQIAVVSLETGDIKTLFRGIFAQYSHTGHIVYVQSDGTLLIAPFDVRRLQAMRPAVSVLEGVAVKLTGAADLSISPSGTVAYVAGEPARFELIQLDTGRSLRTLVEGPPNPRSPRFSTDGRRIALTLRHAASNRPGASRLGRDIWIYEMEKGTSARLTFDGGDDAIWTADGRHLTFDSDEAGVSHLFQTRSDFSGSKQGLLNANQVMTPGSWSPDGRTLLFTQTDSRTRRDILAFQVGATRPPNPYLRTQFNEGSPVISPDGRWVAYESDESGSYEVYVRAFPLGDRKYSVSIGGGREPRWARNGRRLFYWGNDRLIEASISTTPELTVRSRRVLIAGLQYGMGSARDYDVHPDGARFVLARIKSGPQAPQLVVVQNWIRGLHLAP